MKIIQIIQKRAQPINIDIKTKKGESDNVFPIIYGTSKLPSICWIIRYTTSTQIKVSTHPHSATISAIVIEKNVQTYGINSINQAISASVKIHSIFIQKIFNINSHINVRKNIAIHSISCHLSHIKRVLTTSFSLS